MAWVSRSIVSLLWALLVVGTVLQGKAFAADPPGTLTFVGPNKINVKLDSHGFGVSRRYSTNLLLYVENNGSATVTKFDLRLLEDPTFRDSNAVNLSYPIIPLNAKDITPLPVSISVTNRSTQHAWLALAAKQPVAEKSTIIELELLRRPWVGYYWATIVLAALYASVTGFLLIKRHRNSMSSPLREIQGWTFAGTWLPTLAVIGTALSGVLAATNLLSDVFPGIDLARIPGLILLFGSAILASAIVFGAGVKHRSSSGDVKATVRSLIFASALTLFGVGGQLATLASLVILADSDSPEKIFLCLVLACAALVAYRFATTTVGNLAPARLSHSDPNDRGRIRRHS